MKKIILHICSLCLVMVLITGCSKERIAVNKLKGEWRATSYKINGGEAFPNIVGSYKIEFENYSFKDNEGRYESTAVTFGFTSVESGEYRIENEGTQVEFVPDGSAKYIGDIEFDKKELTLEIPGLTGTNVILLERN